MHESQKWKPRLACFDASSSVVIFGSCTSEYTKYSGPEIL